MPADDPEDVSEFPEASWQMTLRLSAAARRAHAERPHPALARLIEHLDAMEEAVTELRLLGVIPYHYG